MAETRKPTYLYAPETDAPAEDYLEVFETETTLTADEALLVLDFEEIEARWWPGDDFAW